MALSKLIYLLKSCWTDPSANKETAHNYRKRQFIAVLKLLPLATFATYGIIIIALMSAWTLVDHSILIVWSVTLFLVGTRNFMLWWRFILRNHWHRFNRYTYLSLSLNLGLAAILYTYLIIQVFAVLDDQQRVVLVAIIGAFSATGCWMFASMPLAGLLWSLFLAGGFGIDLLVNAHSHQLLAYLSIFYSVFLCATVLVTSHKFIDGLIAKSKIEQQGELIGLLLNDFEANANDWLWELDRKGFLRHISVQLVNISGKTEQHLRSVPVHDIMTEFVNRDVPGNQQNHEKIIAALNLPEPFNDLKVAVTINGKDIWWSFKAKPLFNSKQKLIGWRGVTSDITAAYTRELAMLKLANNDSLTGLANRYCFINTLNGLEDLEQGLPSCCVMMLDLDNFKHVNDSQGHHAGDKLLTILAERLQRIMPETALLARLGGDEFAILLTHNATPQAVKSLTQDILQIIAKPLDLFDHSIDMQASIGVSFAPSDADNADDLLNAADIALYQAKEEGRNRANFFTQTLKDQALRKQMLLNDLKVAIGAKQFVLMYQPQFDLNTMQLISFEALVRWQHPSLGMISPDDFIPLAESSQLIIPLGEWILQQACMDCMTWPQSISVAVNVSGVQVEHSDLSITVKNALQNSGLHQSRLELELTESSIMSNNASVFKMLSEFRLAGGRVAIDDFGTGFSSFSYLHSFPLDKLKIDRSFIHLLGTQIPDSKAAAIVQSITQLGKTLNLQITAEGIETIEQQTQLKHLTCDLGQGYLLAKPMKAEGISDFIVQHI